MKPENVWDYPRPPLIEAVPYVIQIEMDGQPIAKTESAFRVCETSHPPTYYIPPHDVNLDFIKPDEGASFCEWKGAARYWAYQCDDRVVQKFAWSYSDPSPRFHAIQNYLCFYGSKVDAAYVGEYKVQAQEGDFYGGWITENLTGPFKGGPGTMGW